MGVQRRCILILKLLSLINVFEGESCWSENYWRQTEKSLFKAVQFMWAAAGCWGCGGSSV